MKQRKIKDVIREYNYLYKTLAPDEDSISRTERLWDAWKEKGESPPDTRFIAENYIHHELGFFKDIVEIINRMENNQHLVFYLPFCLDDHNFHAFTAEDGYIVLVDEYFFQFLYVLTMLLMFYAQGITEENEDEKLRSTICEMVEDQFIGKRRFRFDHDDFFLELIKRDYEIAEFGNYLFSSFKAFILGHEIGHHVLGHTQGVVLKSMFTKEEVFTIEVDNRAWKDELAADLYGFNVFRNTYKTVEENFKYSYMKYIFDFAPIILFEIFDKLDHAKTKSKGTLPNYTTHPMPSIRIKNLINGFEINREDDLYNNLKTAVHDLMP